MANDCIKSKQISSKKYYDTDINVQNFIEGEWAYVWKPAPKGCDSRKFYDHWRGPYEIVKKISSHSYKIKLSEDKYDMVHMELMKAAAPGQNNYPPQERELTKSPNNESTTRARGNRLQQGI